MLVLKVHPGSAAEVAGLGPTRLDSRGDIIPGDIILSVDGRSVDSVGVLLAVFDDHQIGDRVILKIWRAGKELEVPVVLQGGG